MSVVSSIATMESKHPSLFFTFYTNVLITFPWGLNISKVFKIYSFYLMRNKGIYYYYYCYYCYYFWLMRLIFPAWRLKKNSTINQPQKFLAPCGQFCKWQEDEANTDDELDIFPELRAKIPNVPSDTKLSKKTLRYAIRYIKYLIQLLEEGNDQSVVSVSEERETQRKRGPNTGWPQYVWVMEFRKWFARQMYHHFSSLSLIYNQFCPRIVN